jgi:hypothetical protein
MTLGMFFSAVSVAEGRYQRWIPNTDFDNPRNWKSGKVPCRNEHVRFPPSVASVFVQRNHTVMEIVRKLLTFLCSNIEDVAIFFTQPQIEAAWHTLNSKQV